MTPEFHRPIQVDKIGTEPFELTVEAKEAELTALASRLMLPALHSLGCRFTLRRLDRTRIEAAGHLTSRFEQECVVSLEAFPVSIDEEFVIHFLPEEALTDTLDPDAVDELGYTHNVLDLGEAATEQLALTLDPYPRKPQAEAPGVVADAPANPFAVLAGLKLRD